MFDSTDEPTTTETTDPTDYELGMRFTANAAGTITELRYFRGAADAGDTDTRVLNLWNAAGALLGSVTVTSTAGESGWQVGTLSAPIAIEAGATYVVSYGTTQNYAATANYFNTAHSGPDGVLTAGVASGVFAAGTPGVFPTATYNASNYWADVTFVPASEPAVLSSATVGLSETNAVLTTGGTLTISDVDSPATFVAQAGTAGSYGTFTIDAAGVWSYTASSAHDAFVGGTTYSDTFQVASADGTTTSVTVNILGTNDAAVLSSATVGLSETDAVLTTGGTLTISDVDSPATFVAQAGTAGTLRHLHDRCGGGVELHGELGPRRVRWRDDLQRHVPGGECGRHDDVGDGEHSGHQRRGGAVVGDGWPQRDQRGADDGRDADDQRRRQSGDLRGAGRRRRGATAPSRSMRRARGATRPARRTTRSSAGRPTATRFTVASADGTTTSVTVNILGTNDAAVLSSATADLGETNAALTTGGTLTISDVDSAATFVAQAGDGGDLRHLHDRCGGGVELHGELGARRVRWRDDLQRHASRWRAADGTTTSVHGEHPGHQRRGGAVVGDG